MWVTHPATGIVIQEAWIKSKSFLASLKNIKTTIKIWNKETFGNVQRNIKRLKEMILELQSQPQESSTLNTEETIQKNLNEMLHREEMHWKDKAKSGWIEEGDANTHYLHLSTIIHYCHNSICRIINVENEWLTNRESIRQSLETIFIAFFISVDLNFPINLQGLIQYCINTEVNEKLMTILSSVEIIQALMNMENLKSSRLDRFSVLFYNTYGSIVGDAIVEEI